MAQAAASPGLVNHYTHCFDTYTRVWNLFQGIIPFIPQHSRPAKIQHDQWMKGSSMVKLTAYADPNADQESLDEEPGYFVHKNLLEAPHAGTLNLILTSGMKEARSKKIELQETVVGKLVEYLYSGEVKNLTDEEAAGLYPLSDMYDIKYLTPYCYTGAVTSRAGSREPSPIDDPEAVG